MKKMFRIVLCLGFAISASSNMASAQNFVNWIGGVSTDYFNVNNWSDPTMVFSAMNSNYLTIGAGNTNSCLLVGGNSSNTAYRPGKLNVTSAGTFTCNGAVYPNSSDSLNGTVIINASGDLNDRNILYIGYKANSTVTINGGKLTSKNGAYIATGTGGSATVTLNGGSLNVGGGGANMDLSIANAAGLSGQLNILGGGVSVARNLLIGAGGNIYITGVGFLKIAGDKTTQLNGLVSSGQLSCTAGKTLSIIFDGTNTTASIPQNSNSMIVEYPDSVVMNTGKISITVIKSNAKIYSYRYRGVELGGVDKMYTDWQTPYTQLSRCVYSAKIDSPNIADISMRQTFILGTDSVAMDHEVHYVVRRNDSAFYVYIVRSHPASYPETNLDENRYVWKLNQDFTETICVDSARTWKMPNAYDYTQATPTGIAEIIKINTGVRAGKYDCKYEFNKEYWNIGTYGHASNVNKVGIWAVFGGYDFFNDGPTKQDLTSAAGIIHVHFGLDHYMGSNTVVAAGENWSKITGPFMFYTNYHTGGVDSLWANARRRADEEKAQWPYAWLTNEPNYPSSANRGTVSGKFVIQDQLKPSVTGAFAMVGLAKPDPGVNWQFDSKYYQYWVKADASGNFSIPAIRPGTYTLYAYCTGETGEYAQANVVVAAGAAINMGTITWSIVRNNGQLLWEIGVPDRTAKEFRHGDDYFEPYKFLEYSRDFTNPLRYKIGQSNWATDFNYAHGNYLRQPDSAWVTWPWNVYFDLATVPTSGSFRLKLAFAGAESSRMDMYVNDTTYSSLFSRFYQHNGDGNGLLREGIHAKYYDTAIYIPVSKLKLGTNVLSLVMGRAGASANHFMYDYISLEGDASLVLPIQYVAFTATLAGKKALLNWRTSAELNNGHFDIERSADGIHFYKIGSVKSNQSVTGGAYQFVDPSPQEGDNIYRLKQVDTDGKYTHSHMEKIHVNPSAGIQIYPNPVKEMLTIKRNDGKGLQRIKMYDTEGKLVFSTNAVQSAYFTINVASLPQGSYLIQCGEGAGATSHSFVKE